MPENKSNWALPITMLIGFIFMCIYVAIGYFQYQLIDEQILNALIIPGIIDATPRGMRSFGFFALILFFIGTFLTWPRKEAANENAKESDLSL